GEGHVTICARCRLLAWTNTHKESLERIQQFIGCGSLRRKNNHQNDGSVRKPCFTLTVSNRRDFLRIIPALLEHCVIKRAALLRLLDAASNIKRAESLGRGSMEKDGPTVIHKLYWKRRLSFKAIAVRYQVSKGAVYSFFKRHNIPFRPKWILPHVGPEEIRRLYWDEQMTAKQIAWRFGIWANAVLKYMERQGIPRRSGWQSRKLGQE
ncbi:MAG: hypothetical protein ACRDHG_07210, partial [Anaerolineales bacterium]